MKYDQVIVVKSPTKLERIIERFNTKAQAKFYLERSGEDFFSIEEEHNVFYSAFENLNKLLFNLTKYKVIDRSFLPNYIFTKRDLIIGIGQDGLIANIAKYVFGQPIVGLNPNSNIYDGALLPFESLESQVLNRMLNGEFRSKKVCMAMAKFNDGQELLAFNDFFIGPKSHTSARYTIRYNGRSEDQVSSGVLVSTGIGCTGWMSSIVNMVQGIGGNTISMNLSPASEQLVFAVREPFKSQTSSVKICNGIIESDKKLIVESGMVNNGIVFSDGIESDYIAFNLGTSLEVSIAKEKANLVMI